MKVIVTSVFLTVLIMVCIQKVARWLTDWRVG